MLYFIFRNKLLLFIIPPAVLSTMKCILFRHYGKNIFVLLFQIVYQSGHFDTILLVREENFRS